MQQAQTSIGSEYLIKCLRIEPGVFSEEYLVHFRAYSESSEIEGGVLIHQDHVDVKKKLCRVDIHDQREDIVCVSVRENGSGTRYTFNAYLDDIVENLGNLTP